MIQGTRYPHEMFHVDSEKPRVVWSLEEHTRAEDEGWTDRKQDKPKRGPGRPPKEDQ